MLSNIKSFCSNLIIEFRCLCKQNKLIIISMGVTVFIGIIISFQTTATLENATFNGNVIVLIRAKNFNFLLYLLKSLAFFGILYALLIFSRFHFWIFSCNSLLLLFYIKMVFSTLYLTFLFDGFFAYIFFLSYWLPIFLYSLFCYFYVLCKIYCMMGYDRCKGRPLCCSSGNVYTNFLLKCFIINFLPFIIYNIFFIIIFNIIF